MRKIEVQKGSDLDPSTPRFQAAEKACQSLVPVPPQGQRTQQQAQQQAQALQYAQCMRTHGVPTFPDPDFSHGITFSDNGSYDPNSPSFQAANHACGSLLSGGNGGNCAERQPRPRRVGHLGQLRSAVTRRRIAALLTGAAIIAILAGALLATDRLAPDSPPTASQAPVATATVERKTLDATTQVDGTLGYADSYMPGAPSAYTVANALPTTGGADAASLLSAYAQAQAQYDSAANALAALEQPTATDTAQAQAQLAQVEATLTAARQSAAGPTRRTSSRPSRSSRRRRRSSRRRNRPPRGPPRPSSPPRRRSSPRPRRDSSPPRMRPPGPPRPSRRRRRRR